MKKSPNPRFVSRLTQDSLALVMAGGRGARLKGLTLHRAKPAVHFGGKYRVIDFTLSNCINSGIRRIGVLTQYESHCLIRHLQHGWGFLRGQFGEFIELLPAEQRLQHSQWYAGTADAVYQNIDFIRIHQPRQVIILAGDHIYKMDYGAMLAHHVQTGAEITVGCIEVPCEEAAAFGVVDVNKTGRVMDFVEKPLHPDPLSCRPGQCLVSMGIYIFDTRFLLEQLIRDAQQAESARDFGKNIIPTAISRAHVQAYIFRDLDDHDRQGYWRDVGTVDAYWKANIELTDETPELNLYDERWPIWTRQEQVPPAKFMRAGHADQGTAVDSLVSNGCVIAGGSVRQSVLFTHARVYKGSNVEQSLLLPGATIGSRCLIRRAIIDAGCQLPNGTVIGVEPEADAQRYYRTEAGITLVTRSMLEGKRPTQRSALTG